MELGTRPQQIPKTLPSNKDFFKFIKCFNVQEWILILTQFLITYC